MVKHVTEKEDYQDIGFDRASINLTTSSSSGCFITPEQTDHELSAGDAKMPTLTRLADINCLSGNGPISGQSNSGVCNDVPDELMPEMNSTEIIPTIVGNQKTSKANTFQGILNHLKVVSTYINIHRQILQLNTYLSVFSKNRKL